MAFKVNLEIVEHVASMALSGELDAEAAVAFKAKVEAIIAQQVKQLNLLMHDLEYISSAGLRILVFAKQKLGHESNIYVVGLQAQVLETIMMVGFHQSVIMLDTHEKLS